jgi:serine protease Do
MTANKSKKLLFIFLFIFLLMVSLLGGALADRLFGYKILDRWFPRKETTSEKEEVLIDHKILKEESIVIDVVEEVSPSVVTVGVKKTQQIFDPFFDFFDPFNLFGLPQQREEQKEEEIEQDIGSGFVISTDGLVATNKHVVSDSEAEYKVITKDNEEYQVEKIYRDPSIDLAILKINAGDLKPVKLGNSDDLKVGQFVIAIGTALGEFRNTVTTGVISGLGRGVTAGDPFAGYEDLENVIQTDAAINPGNSGGPLLNSLGQVIGVNAAVTAGAENIGFAIPINIVKEALDNFNKTGKFERPYLGVRYKIISKDLALLNEVPEGAYIVEVIKDSPADKAGVKKGDIILKIDNKKVTAGRGGLAQLIQDKKIGDKVKLEIWREGEALEREAKLESGE